MSPGHLQLVLLISAPLWLPWGGCCDPRESPPALIPCCLLLPCAQHSVSRPEGVRSNSCLLCCTEDSTKLRVALSPSQQQPQSRREGPNPGVCGGTMVRSSLSSQRCRDHKCVAWAQLGNQSEREAERALAHLAPAWLQRMKSCHQTWSRMYGRSLLFGQRW